MRIPCPSALLIAALVYAAPAHAAPDRDAQVELATYGAVYGLGLGVLTSLETDVRLRPAAWITAATTAGGLFGGLTLVDELDLSVSQVRLTGSIAGWAMADTLLIAAWAGWFDDGTAWTMMGAGALGAGGGLLLAANGFDPQRGDVALVNSSGLWAIPAGLLFGFTFHLGSGDHLPRDVLLLSKLGLGAGILLARAFDPTHEQVLYLDLGLLAGGLAGGLLGAIISVYSDRFEPASALTLVGMGLGAWIAIDAVGFDGARPTAPATDPMSLRAVTIPLVGGAW